MTEIDADDSGCECDACTGLRELRDEYRRFVREEQLIQMAIDASVARMIEGDPWRWN